jgi:hypothetical protein
MLMKMRLRQAAVIMAALTVLIGACSGAPQATRIVEITREVPATVIVTQVVVQTATPAAQVSPTIEPSATPKPTKGPKPTDPAAPTRTLDPSKPTEPVYYIPIKDCNTSRIHVNDTVWVTINGGSNGIRKEPDVAKDNIITYADPGTQLKVLSGPVCSYKWILWEVELPDGTKGWTPEGNGKVFWLTP